ncbi:MAG: ABC transporter ATP-binding protein [Bacillota bacterium]
MRVQPGDERTPLGIAANSVSFSYPRSTFCLEDVSFEVAPGSIFGLVGPNGAGKTTLVKLLCGLRKPSQGNLAYVNGSMRMPPLDARGNLAVVHQAGAFDLFLTLNSNLRNYVAIRKLSIPDYQSRVLRIAEALDISECLRLPVMNLSGGQIRKAQLLRILLAKPSILIMDEPMAGVDGVSRRNAWDLINELRNKYGTTVIWTTHDLQDMEKRTNTILILSKGKALWSGGLGQIGDMFEVAVAEVDLNTGLPVTAQALLKSQDVVDVEWLSEKKLKAILSKKRGATPLLQSLLECGIEINNIVMRPISLEETLLLISNKERRERGG